MPTLTDPQMMRAVIMDHYEHPHNKRDPKGSGYKSVHMDTVGCVDDIHVGLKIVKGVIQDVVFNGVACTISTASTSIMTDLLRGKTLSEATFIIDQYMKMIHEQPYDAQALDEAIVFKNTYKQAARIRCATIGWLGAQQIIQQEDKNHG